MLVQIVEELKRVLIHGIYICQVSDAEEQQTGTLTIRLILTTSIINLHLSFLSNFLFFLNLVGNNLGLRQC